MMFSDESPSAFNARIEALTQALEASADADTGTCARELVRLVLDFHGAGLQRIVKMIDGESLGLAQRLAADPVVASLFALHDLLPAGALAGETTPRADTAQAPLVQISRRAVPVSNSAIRAHGDNASVCERCGAALADSHHHHVDVTTRQLSCSCRACWLLYSAHPGRGSYRPVPDRYLAGPALLLTSAQWDALQVPVNVAFFMFNSIAGRTIAFYPSPAGATESALSLSAWRDVEAANPWVRVAAPDVEALLVRSRGDMDSTYECFVVPIDACYELVGRIRLHWNGLDGGDVVRNEIDRFFAEVAARTLSVSTTPRSIMNHEAWELPRIW